MTKYIWREWRIDICATLKFSFVQLCGGCPAPPARAKCICLHSLNSVGTPTQFHLEIFPQQSRFDSFLDEYMCDNWNIFTFDGPKKYVKVEFGRKYINVYYFSRLVGVEFCIWYFCRIFHYWYLEHYWIFRKFSISGYWNNSWRRNANMVVGETSWCPPYISFKPFQHNFEV